MDHSSVPKAANLDILIGTGVHPKATPQMHSLFANQGEHVVWASPLAMPIFKADFPV
jgi:hypothetical protein